MYSFLFLYFLFLSGHESKQTPTAYETGETSLVYPVYGHTFGIHKATSFHLFLFVGTRTKFRTPKGLAAVRLESWGTDPKKSSEDVQVTVYGVNSGENNIIYNTSMYGLDIYGIDEPDEQKLKSPWGIAANSKGDVYVADTGNHRIVRLWNPKKKLSFVGSIGKFGAENGEFNSPRQVALDSRGNIYVSDTGNDRVQVFDAKNNFQYSITGVGIEKLTKPDALCVTDQFERWSYFQENFLLVGHENGSKISKYTLSGKWIKTISGSSTGLENVHFSFMALDFYSQVWVTDEVNNCIYKFDKDLNFLTKFGKKGGGYKEFIEPAGITIWKRFGQTFVAEKTGAQYFWVGTDIQQLTANEKNRQIEISFRLSEPSFVRINVFEQGKNEMITQIFPVMTQMAAGLHNVMWNFNSIQKVKKFRFQIEIQPTYSSYTHFIKYQDAFIEINK